MRIFHVLPMLYIDRLSMHGHFVKGKHVRLEVASDGMAVEPRNGKIRITRPLPNKGYFVGGVDENRLGWFVPMRAERFAITFLWNIHVPETDYRLRIGHRISVLAQPDDALNPEGSDDRRIWTMDVMPWWRREGFYQGEPPVNVQPASRLSLEEIHPVRKARPLEHLIECPETLWDGADVVGYGEDIVVPPVSEGEFLRRSLGAACGIAPVIPPFLAAS
jgi:hypothetical protein